MSQKLKDHGKGEDTYWCSFQLSVLPKEISAAPQWRSNN